MLLTRRSGLAFMTKPLGAILKDLGIAALKIGDQYIAQGAGAALYDLGKVVRSSFAKDEGLDWAFPYQTFYQGELNNLLTIDADGETYLLPQTKVFLPTKLVSGATLGIELIEPDFQTRCNITLVLDLYRAKAARTDAKFFDGENARLINATEQSLTFQGCSYFDYISTNLALDYPLPMGTTLRHQLHGDGRLGPLASSPLANAAGINGLLFSRDGHLILQRRSDRVLIRPHEICPSFSGTVDKEDIVKARLLGSTFNLFDAPREMVEELGIRRSAIINLAFLGITRELIRGGAPELFYAMDVDMAASTILKLHPADREGQVFGIPLGHWGKSIIAERFPATPSLNFRKVLSAVASAVGERGGRISTPLHANLVLWNRINAPLGDAGPH